MSSRTTHTKYFTDSLRANGLKATPTRLALLELLRSTSRPLATHEIVSKLSPSSNQATVYRTLEYLRNIGMVRRVDMQHAHAHYELLRQGDHHHHLICRECFRTEDIDGCEPIQSETAVLAQTKDFARIESHTLEFFGVCKSCARMKKPTRTHHYAS